MANLVLIGVFLAGLTLAVSIVAISDSQKKKIEEDSKQKEEEPEKDYKTFNEVLKSSINREGYFLSNDECRILIDLVDLTLDGNEKIKNKLRKLKYDSKTSRDYHKTQERKLIYNEILFISNEKQ